MKQDVLAEKQAQVELLLTTWCKSVIVVDYLVLLLNKQLKCVRIT